MNKIWKDITIREALAFIYGMGVAMIIIQIIEIISK